MHRHLLKSKIPRATITSVDLHYEGSLTLGPLHAWRFPATS
jgi:aspartate 1-decarboxylase